MKIFPFLFLFIIIAFSCTKKKTDKNQFDTYRLKAQFFEEKNRWDSTFYYYEKAKSSCSDEKCIVYVLMKMAMSQEFLGDYSGSEKTATKALSYFKYCDCIDYKNEIYNCLGVAYKKRKEYELALQYYNESLKNISHENDRLILLNNIAVISIEQEEYYNAINQFKKILAKFTFDSNKKSYARIIDNLGYAYLKEGNKSKAYHYLTESLQIRDSLGEDYERIASLIHLARFYQDSLPELTVDYAQKAYQAALNVKSPDDQIEALGILIPNTTGIQSKEYFQKFMTTKDSIDLVRQTAKNQFAKMEYDYSLISKDAEIQKTQKIIYLLLVFIVLLSSLYIFFHIKRKNKIKLQIENQKTVYETETRISKKLHDELANDVFQTLSFVQTQELETNRESLINNLDEIYKKTRNISRENNDIATGKDFEEDFLGMIANFQDDKVNIIINKEEANLNQIADEKQIALYRVIRELLVNMKKYSQASLVVLNFTLDKELKINYSDNGKGFEKKKSPGGLQSAENRILALNGTITFDTMPGKGLKVSIIIPKN